MGRKSPGEFLVNLLVEIPQQSFQNPPPIRVHLPAEQK